MSERGESLDPLGMLNVASWRMLRASPSGDGKKVLVSWRRLRSLRLFQAPAAMDVLRVAIVGFACIAVQATQHRLARLLRRGPGGHRNGLPAPSGVTRIAEGAIGLERGVLWRRRRPSGACSRNQKERHQNKRPAGEPHDSSHAFLPLPISGDVPVNAGQCSTAALVAPLPSSNMRAERTRSSPSARPPLTRHPLGA